MPIYEFECGDCGRRFDRLQKLSDPDPTDCPACARSSVRRRITAPSFRLAGSGWYETDFKKDGDKKRNLAGEGGGEAKPAEAVKPDAGKSDAPAASSAAATVDKPTGSTAS